MPTEFCADDMAEPVDDVEHAFRQTCFMQAFGQDLRLYRAHLARFDDDGRAGGDSGCELRGDKADVAVPRRDSGGDTGRLHDYARSTHTALELVALQNARHGEKARSSMGNSETRESLWSAVFERHRFGEVGDAGGNSGIQPLQHANALGLRRA